MVPYEPQLQWSPDGRELLAIVVQTPSAEAAQPRDDDPLLQAGIVRVDVITGTQTPVTKLFISRYEKPQNMIWHASLHSLVALVLLWVYIKHRPR